MSGSHHVHKAFESSDAHRYAAHITPNVQPYAHQRHVAHDRTTKVIPSHQAATMNSYKHYNEVNSENNVGGAWQGSSVFNDFIVPQTIQVIEGCWLRFTLKWTSAASGDLPVPRPALQMIDSITYMFENGNDTQVLRGEVEQLLFVNETSNEDYARLAHSYGCHASDRAGVYGFTAATGANQVVTREYMVKLGGVLGCSKLFAAGLEGEPLRIRVNWASSATTSVGGNAAQTIELQQSQLVIEETQLAQDDFERLMAQYRSPNGVQHRFIEQRVSTHPFVCTSGQQLQVTTQTHAGLAAGTLVFIRSQSQTGTAPTSFLALTDAQWFDERNLKLQPKMTDSMLRSVVHRACDFPSNGAQQVPSYFFPFNLSLHATLQHTMHTGSLKMSGRDAFHFTCSAAMAAANSGAIQVEIVSLNYAFLSIQRGRISVEKS
jgi:hypothetical protein